MSGHKSQAMSAFGSGLLNLRSHQTDSVSVDLHQQRLWFGRLLSFGHTCGRVHSRKIKSRHSRIPRPRRPSANIGSTASRR